MLKIESGFDSIKAIRKTMPGIDRSSSIANTVKAVGDYFYDKTGEELILVPYTSMKRNWISCSKNSRSGGFSSKRIGMSFKNIRRQIEEIEKIKIGNSKGRFNLVMNNAFTYGEIDYNSKEFQLAEIINERNLNYGFEHEITVASKIMLQYINEHFPNARTVVSVKSSSAKGKHYMDFPYRFKNANSVVIDNTYKNDEFQKKYEQHFKKMVFFLSNPCNFNIKKCIQHYQMVEGQKMLPPIEYELDEFRLSKTGNCCAKNNYKGKLNKYHDDLLKISDFPKLYSREGKQYKFPRGHKISIKAIDYMVNIVNTINS